MTTTDESTIQRWRFDHLREAVVLGIQLSGDLLRDAEQGNFLEPENRYHKLVELLAALSKGLREGTQP